MITSNVTRLRQPAELAVSRKRSEALSVILPRLSALSEPALPVIATTGRYQLREMQHAGLTIWFTWFENGLNVVVYDGAFIRYPDGSASGVEGSFPKRMFSITFDPNNIGGAKPMGWKRGDWEARIFQTYVPQ